MTSHRFVLVHNENVIDTSKSNSKVQYSDVYSTSEKSLRESVLIHRLKKFVDRLLLNDNPDKQNPHWERPHEDPENFSLAQIIFHTVIASRLNARDETSPLKLRFDGKQHRIVRWQDSSSISLFITDSIVYCATFLEFLMMMSLDQLGKQFSSLCSTSFDSRATIFG